MNKTIKAWIEAMRLRTLPVSIAGVIAAAGCAAYYAKFRLPVFLVCLSFAIVAQIISNFANEYFDFRKGLDKKGREGFRRGVTEGDISPSAMRNAILILLVVDGLIGLATLFWGPWWLIMAGILIAVFAVAYSAGPYPLSHHGLGEIAVILFFGLIPVILTTYLQVSSWDILPVALPIALAIGIMGANVLIVNNYRDADDDKEVNKRTTAVIFGRKTMQRVYFINGMIAIVLIECATITRIPIIWQAGMLAYANFHYMLWVKLKYYKGSQLNPVLGQTAMLMFGVAIWLTLALCLNAPSA